MIASKINHFVSGVVERIEIIYFFLFGLLLGAIILKIPFLAVFLLFGLIVTTAFLKKPLHALAVLIFLMPYAKTIYLRTPLMMKGTEPIHLIATFVFVIALINIKDSVEMPKGAMLFLIVILTVFTIAGLRSIPNLELINMRYTMGGRDALSISGHILKTMVRPMFYFLPIIVLLKFVRNKDNLDFIVKIISFTMLIYSLCILYLYFIKIPSRSLADANLYYQTYMGLQRNTMADPLILGLPFLLARFFQKKNIFNVSSICLCIIAIGFTFTRTAYGTTILAFLFYLIFSKRAKLLPVLIAIAFCLTFVVSAVIIERASKGFDTMNTSDISSGRIDRQWVPLIEEYLDDPSKLLFGNGRFAMLSSKSVAQGLTPDSMYHPHNMYLEQILDGGIISFMVVISFFAVIMLKIFNSLSSIRDNKIQEYQYAVFVSLISYFIAGMTGRTLFPSGKNGLFWLILGLGIIIIRMAQELKEDKLI